MGGLTTGTVSLGVIISGTSISIDHRGWRRGLFLVRTASYWHDSTSTLSKYEITLMSGWRISCFRILRSNSEVSSPPDYYPEGDRFRQSGWSLRSISRPTKTSLFQVISSRQADGEMKYRRRSGKTATASALLVFLASASGCLT